MNISPESNLIHFESEGQLHLIMKLLITIIVKDLEIERETLALQAHGH